MTWLWLGHRDNIRSWKRRISGGFPPAHCLSNLSDASPTNSCHMTGWNSWASRRLSAASTSRAGKHSISVSRLVGLWEFLFLRNWATMGRGCACVCVFLLRQPRPALEEHVDRVRWIRVTKTTCFLIVYVTFLLTCLVFTQTNKWIISRQPLSHSSVGAIYWNNRNTLDSSNSK